MEPVLEKNWGGNILEGFGKYWVEVRYWVSVSFWFFIGIILIKIIKSLVLIGEKIVSCSGAIYSIIKKHCLRIKRTTRRRRKIKKHHHNDPTR
ncbi:hypothetical protein [Rochambeau virus]|uniref:Uncharacterized protein n=1 Tax=Rochambeau virus TaxID=380435 RepID=A0A0D3R1K8_9RHAB|nr:hypothetical protein [Rochambeau virus]AJR28506.1 hypothetical protein [Rochambeau virus]